MRELLVLSYDPDKPSFRYRIAPLLAELETRGWSCRVDVLPQRRYGLRIWQRRAALRASSVVLLHKLRLAPWEMAWLSRCNPRCVFDIDDATWLSQPKQVGAMPAASASRRRAFAAICRGARLTLAGNRFLAGHAEAAGARVELIPTAVAVGAYPHADLSRRSGGVAVWIGLPGNLQYLDPLRPALAEVARRHPQFRLRIVSSRFPDWDDVPLERVPWRPGIETSEALLGADIGLMPLADDDFARGKCAFKLLQYMAATLPCIASPVGANRDVVDPGRTGLLADTPDAWRDALEQLLVDRGLREAMGRAGRERVQLSYDLGVVVPRAADLVEALLKKP
jgi:glycosyltransferase involved in cell wall biosynthesis